MPLLGLLVGLLLPDAWPGWLERGIRFFKMHARLTVLFLILLLAGILIAINRKVLLSFMNSADEHSCFFFAQCLEAGKFWARPHPLQAFFETVHIGAIGDKWFSVYPPGWPLVWALGLKLHLKDVLNPWITAVSMAFFFDSGRKTYGFSTALLASVFLVISPFFLMTGAAYYSHNLCLLLILLFWSAMLRLEETGKWIWAAVAGLALGYALGTRYLTAAAMSAPLVFQFFIQTLKNRGKNKFPFKVFSVLVFLLLGLQLFYNHLLTGRFWNPPNHYLHSHEKLGFIAGYPPALALQYLVQRIFYLIDWTPPGWILFFLFTAFIRRPVSSRDFCLRASIVFLAAGYMLYYSWGGNQYGPRYYYEAYPFSILFVSFCLVQTWKSSALKIRKMISGALVFSALATIPLLIRHFTFYHQITGERRALYDAAEKNSKLPALVFLKGFLGDSLVMAPDDSIRNSPFLDAPVVYAHDRGNDNTKLIPFFPNRHYYTGFYDRDRHRPQIESLSTSS